MEKISAMIEHLCPEGVEKKKIKDAFKRLKGTPITAGIMKEIEDCSGDVTIYAGGRTIIKAFEKDIPNANIISSPSVVVQSRGIIDVQYCDTPFTFKNEMWAYTCTNSKSVKYLFYYLKQNVEVLRKKGSEHGSMPQISLNATEELEVPFPPLPIQQEIVRILDSFTSMITNLETELASRQKQYEYYRNKLLTFDENDESVEWKTLKDFASIYDGTHQTPIYIDEGIPFVSVENIGDIYNSHKYISKEDYAKYKIKPQVGDVFMTRIGSIGICALFDKQLDIAYYVSLALLRPNKDIVTSGYLKYIIESDIGSRELRKRTLVHAVPIKVNKEDIGKILLPIPSLQRQREIVSILDTFESLTQNIKQELEARKKQYEYYREQLLTFE